MIELIKVLRERTGAGNLDCKKALEANDMDVDKAVDYLREKGVAKVAKKASRIAAEGLCDIKVCEKCGRAAIVEVNCETDFVARGDIFHKLVADSVAQVLHEGYESLDEAKKGLEKMYLEAGMKLGEKLDFRRFQIVEKKPGQMFGTYIHNGSQIGVIVVIDKEDEELATGLAMHIAANNPSYICEHCIPQEVIEKEKHIAIEAAKEDPKLANKPDAVVQHIIEGKVNKLLKETTLLEQPYLLDGEQTVGAVLKQKGINVVDFVRFAVGEGIEKRHEDFAEEVAKQIQ